MYNFNPVIKHIDYSMALRKALLSEDLFKKNLKLSIASFILFNPLLRK